ncbi:Zn-dependent peptidase ImmA (M78 family) [Kitasatospora gansuensis]|uniref:Zn-dependent peptidase ImmA (M78 family) n=1 Tax=Kitasatospora gansuensis TaxID=258050 RepID=A0A7W7WKE5_9ACTN|nr:XRE family transcriptional regulator [Kitasatospora gansuensis]MBB4949634.1 Zn-dependent peptidase ImmA (M78 family) [Kitasatospora gansuensis]
MVTVPGASPAERLRTLREMLGLTQGEMATMAGLSPAWISSVETQAREATEDGLRAIASGTGTPMSFFSAAPSTVPLDSLRFRKTAGASRTVTKRITAFYSESYRVTEHLLEFQGYPPPPLPMATNELLDDEDIEQFAAATRQALRLAPDKPIPHMTRALERSGVAVAPIVLTDPAGEQQRATTNHFGVSYWGGIGEGALVGYFPGSSGDRDRFTLAHELGHLVLHTFRPQAVDPEGEANRFAGAFLVPYERAVTEITDRLSLNGYARLKATWGVSIQALIMRGAVVGTINESRKRSLFVQLTQRGWRKEEPVPVGKEEPLLIWNLLTRRFGEKPYVPAAEELAIHPTVLRSIAPTPGSSSSNAQPPSRGGGSVVEFRRRHPNLSASDGPSRLAH